MILYLDTSAIVKKYFKEQGSIEVIRLWKKTSSIVTSTVTYAETLAAIHLASALIVQHIFYHCRARREQPSPTPPDEWITYPAIRLIRLINFQAGINQK